VGFGGPGEVVASGMFFTSGQGGGTAYRGGKGEGGRCGGYRQRADGMTGSFDATVRLWDCKSQSVKPIQVLDEARDSVSSLHVLGHEIVTGSVDGRVRLYDLRMGMLHVDVLGRMYFTLTLSQPLQYWTCFNGVFRVDNVGSTDQGWECGACVYVGLDH